MLAPETGEPVSITPVSGRGPWLSYVRRRGCRSPISILPLVKYLSLHLCMLTWLGRSCKRIRLLACLLGCQRERHIWIPPCWGSGSHPPAQAAAQGSEHQAEALLHALKSEQPLPRNPSELGLPRALSLKMSPKVLTQYLKYWFCWNQLKPQTWTR